MVIHDRMGRGLYGDDGYLCGHSDLVETMTDKAVDTSNPWNWGSKHDATDREIRRTVALENEIARLKADNHMLMLALRPQGDDWGER